MWHSSHKRVTMEVADGLVPIRHQDICNHDHDIDWLVPLRGVRAKSGNGKTLALNWSAISTFSKHIYWKSTELIHCGLMTPHDMENHVETI